MDAGSFYALGFLLVAAGIIVIVVAIVIASTRGSEKEKGKVRSAGVIMIGPIPIIFGSDKKMTRGVLALALALTIVALIFLLVYWWLLR